MLPELILASIIISLFIGISGTLSGATLFLMLHQYSAYLVKAFNEPLPSTIIKRGVIIGAFNLAIGLFFFIRILWMLYFGDDIVTRVILVYDAIVGVYLFVSSSFFYILYKARAEMDRKITENCTKCKRNVIETFTAGIDIKPINWFNPQKS